MTQKENSHIFKGRQIERTQFLNFVKENKKGYFCILGHPGIGKSALMAEFIQDVKLENELSNVAIIASWIRRGTAQAQIEYFLNNLIKRTDDLFPQAKEIKAEGKTFLDLQQQLFSKWWLWSEQKGDTKLLIFIDGLDEGAENNLVTYLPRQLFENIIFVYSSRPGVDAQIEELWPSLPEENLVKIELGGLTENNIREILDEVAQRYKLKVEDSWLRNVVIASQGNPLYLKLMCDSIEKGVIKINESNILPNELNDYYKTILQRFAKNTHGEGLLRSMYSLAAAKDFLTLKHLGLINNLDDEALQHIGVLVKEFCYESILAEGVIGYQLFHESLREYLVKWETANVDEANTQIIHFCSTWKEQTGKWEQRYALEYYVRHLSESSQKEHQTDLLNLFQNKDYTDTQKKVLRHFDATKQLYQRILEKSIEINDNHLQLEAALHLVDLKNEEAAEAPHVLTLVANNEIELALKRIESFAGEDKEGLKRKFKIYMLCLMELTLLDSKNKSFQKEAIEKLLNHLDEQLPVDTEFLNWDDFFPINLVFKMAGEWAALGLDYKIVFKRGFFYERNVEVILEREAPYSDSELKVLANYSSPEFFRRHLIKQMKFEEALELARSLNNESDIFIALTNKSTELGKHGKKEKALAVIQEALTYIRSMSSDYQKKSAIEGIFTSLEHLESLEKALELARTLNNEFEMSIALLTIGRYVATNIVVGKELSILNEASECARRISEEWQKNIAFKDIGIEFAKHGRVNEALDIARTINDLSTKSNILQVVASELAKQGRTSEASSLLQEALNAISLLIDNEHSRQNQEQNETEENNWVDYESFDEEDDFDFEEEIVYNEERLDYLKTVLGEDYDEKDITSELENLLEKIYSQMVKLGKGEEVYKFILGVGHLMYKIRALLYLSTEENNVNKENGSVIFNGFYRDINEISKSLNSDDQHYVKKITTLALIEQDRLEMAKDQMNETLNKTISDERGNDVTWWCFDDFIPALEKKGKLELATDWVKSIDEDWIRNKFLDEISLKLMRLGKINEAIAAAREGERGSALAAISSELFILNLVEETRQTMQEARELSLSIADNHWSKSEIIKAICSELSYQSKWQDMIEVMLKSITSGSIIMDKDDRDNVLTDISIELAKQRNLKEAFTLTSEIGKEWKKNKALTEISIELAKQGKVEEVTECVRGINNDRDKSDALSGIIIEFTKQNRLEDAFKCVHSINDKIVNSALKQICSGLIKLNQFDIAIQSARIMKNGMDKFDTLLEISIEMASHGYTIKKYEKQLNLFESTPHTIIDSRSILNEALKCSREINSCEAMLSIAAELANQGHKEDVEPVLHEALACIREMDNNYWKAVLLKDISNSLFTQDKIEIAATTLDEALMLMQNNNLNFSLYSRYEGLSDISCELIEQGQIKKAKKLLRDILSEVRLDANSKLNLSKDDLEEKLFGLEKITPQLIKLSMIKEAFSVAINPEWFWFNPLNEIFNELIKQNKVEEAFKICEIQKDITIKTDLQRRISIGLAKLCKFEEALAYAQDISDLNEKDKTLKEISIEMAKQGKLEEAIECSDGISDERDKSSALKGISTEMAEQGKLEEAIECSDGISDERDKSRALEVISTEMAKQGNAEEAFEIARNIWNESDKNDALHQIALELINQRNFILMEKVGSTISNLSERRELWQKIATELLKESSSQFFLQTTLQFQFEEVRNIFLKELIGDINILKTDQLFMQDCLQYIVHDSECIEKLLTKYAIRTMFLTDVSDEQVYRLNKSLGIQWAVDIYNKLN
jgi:hypothetical protein